MAEVQNKNINETTGTTNTKKRKGFLSNIFGRSSNTTDADGKKPDQAPQNNGGITSTVKTGAGQVAQHVAVDEASKEIEKLLNNNSSSSNNGSQPANASATMTSAAPDTTALSDALSAPTNWAKRMADSVQQKLQTLGS
ncbi:hypothetical protein L210DRAFT_3650795 [Boletus edulis BED1]|uniref:Uncharacterized protein n=1 Tax=Boletus edulis BED1 TaxID=1328754 RepID=A0AAD4G9W2_BOLED|nr:hypothetical protein L210DRAFT_3650795 [Boletus edulis BED1]